MDELRALVYVEIDIKFCQETFGVAPCTASGSPKCYNTRNFDCDCQDTANFNPGTKTLTFGLYNVSYLPEAIPCIPLLASASIDPAGVLPGEAIGKSATCSVSFINSPHGDGGIDPYISDRGYDPYTRGTFWGKFRARNPFVENRPIRIKRGYLGMDYADFETHHFIIQSISGPNSKGGVTIKGADFMRLLSDSKAQAPAVSEGYLSADIDDGVTSCTLEPAGIGSTYPASGKAAIGEEIVSFTRSGDVLTITRSQNNTDAAEHKAEDVVQVILEYVSQKSSYIVNDLITNYSQLDSSYTDVTWWDEIVDSFSDVLYSAVIVKPTSVERLLNELVEQAGLVLFADTERNQVHFDVLRTNTASGALTEDQIFNLSQVDQPQKRFSQVWVWYNIRDQFKNITDKGNFYSAFANPNNENLFDTESVKQIYSRWIAASGRSIAEDVANRVLARYTRPPRKIQFELFANAGSIRLGEVRQISHPALESCSGDPSAINIIVTGKDTRPDGYVINAEEYVFDASALSGPKIVPFDYDEQDANLRSKYDVNYSTVDEVNDIIFIVPSGVVVSASNTSVFAIETGSWPAGATIKLVVYGHIVGRGGSGVPNGVGGNGGDALHVTNAIEIDNQGVIGSGGGAGGGKLYNPGPGVFYEIRGGGGASYGMGSGFTYNLGDDQAATPAGLETGQSGVVGGGTGVTMAAGGDLGQNGANGDQAGGTAGVAVDGDSLVTWTNLGTVHGSRIN